MTGTEIPTTLRQVTRLAKEGEGPAVEFKRSTGELKEGLQTICAFLNGSGGVVLFGVRSDGTIEGQQTVDRNCGENCGDNCGENPCVAPSQPALHPGRNRVVNRAQS